MTEEKKDNELTDADVEWQGLSQLKAEREGVELPDSGEDIPDDGGGTLAQRTVTSPKMTDFQTLVAQLSPTLKAKWLELIRVSRVFPEAFPNLERLFIKGLLCEYTDMSLVEATAIVYHVLSTGFDGEGRIELITSYTGSSGGEKDDSKKLLGS